MGDLSEHFSRAEFACKCGCGMDTVDAELITLLEEMRSFLDVPIHITSGNRCLSHNTSVNGSSQSLHMESRAADIVCDNVPPDIVADLAEQLSFRGVGRYATFTHVDTRSGNPVRW